MITFSIEDDFIFNEYTIDDTLDSLSRLEKYYNSDFSLQRFVLQILLIIVRT